MIRYDLKCVTFYKSDVLFEIELSLTVCLVFILQKHYDIDLLHYGL